MTLGVQTSPQRVTGRPRWSSERVDIVNKFGQTRDRNEASDEHHLRMLSTPLYYLVDPTNHLRGQDRLLISLGGGIANISGHPGSPSFLGGKELPLPRKKEILVLPFRVAGELGVDLDKLPPSRLEVVKRRTLRVLLEPVEVQKLSYCESMPLPHGQGP
jgi:hypothetical protein